jgi:hypothetical protein
MLHAGARLQTRLQGIEQAPIGSQAAVHFPITRDQPAAHCLDSQEKPPLSVKTVGFYSV